MIRIPGLEVQQSLTSTSSSSSSTISNTAIISVTTEEEEVEVVREEEENSSSQNNVHINNNLRSSNIEESQIESVFVESCTIVSEENANHNETFDDDSVTIPVFNFATSNTSSQNLINLLSNPLLRHRNTTQNIEFSNEVVENDDEEEEEESEEILPTSLNVEYIPEEQQQQPDENITIIPVSAESFNDNEANSKAIDDSKVTKIKIEVDYDYLCKATSQIPSPLPSTSNGSNGVNKSEVKSTPKKQPLLPLNPTPKSTPVHEKRKSLREQQVHQLRQEFNNEIRFKLRKKDCIDSIAFISFKESLWIAGFKPNPQLYVFHIGDQLLAINNIANIKSNLDAQKYIKMCGGLFVEITIRRLPLAKIFIIRRDFENQCLGLIRDGNSLLDIIPNSIASRSGIPTRPNEDDSIFWIITEINFRPLSLISHKKYDETDLLLNAIGLETSLLLQPSDFIAKIRKDLKAMKNYRDYTLQ